MKHIILFLAFFGVLLAHAQEMDTTFVVNEQGQTVGIIHEKGTVPVIPQQQNGPQDPSMQQAMQPQPQPQPAPMFEADSTAYYQSLIEQYTTSGNKTRKTGKILMLSGGIGAAVGLGLLAIGAQESCDTDAWGNEICTSNSDELAASGAIVMIGGAVVFGVGTIVKMVGSSKIRKARRYEDRLLKHQLRRQYSMKMRFDPLIDPINKSVGGNLALQF